MAQQQPLQQTGPETSSSSQQFGQQGGTIGREQPSMGHGEMQGQSSQQGGQMGQQGQMSSQAYQQQPQQGQFGQQGGTIGREQSSQQGGKMGQTLEDAISSEMRLTLQDFVEAAEACEWCADQCIDEGPEMAECIRLCRDVADLALQNVRFVARDSIFGPELAETFAHAAEECAQECARHRHEHCQECASVLQRAAKSTHQMLDSIGQGQGQVQQPQQY